MTTSEPLGADGRLWLNISEVPISPNIDDPHVEDENGDEILCAYRAELVVMDRDTGDTLLAAFTANRETTVRAEAGKYLRNLGRLIDGVPTVSCIDIRNDALETHIEHAAEGRRYEYIQNAAPFDLLKVMIALEHETPTAMRTVQEIFLDRDAFQQNHNSGHYARGFPDKPIDPVTEYYREINATSAGGRLLDTPSPYTTEVLRINHGTDVGDDDDDDDSTSLELDELDNLDLGSLGGGLDDRESRSRGGRRRPRP